MGFTRARIISVVSLSMVQLPIPIFIILSRGAFVKQGCFPCFFYSLNEKQACPKASLPFFENYQPLIFGFIENICFICFRVVIGLFSIFNVFIIRQSPIVREKEDC